MTINGGNLVTRYKKAEIVTLLNLQRATNKKEM